MTVCNSCRYCEAYCPVFQAMEERLTFSSGDVAYLANLCHNCGECLYACQYAPPHEFGIDVPKTFSALRVESYEAAAWPAFAAPAFRRPWTTTAVALAAGALASALAARTLWVREDSVAFSAAAARTFEARDTADFYSVIPHDVMVTLFGITGLFAVLALSIGFRRFTRSIADLEGPRRISEGVADQKGPRRTGIGLAARDALTLKHLHATGEDCVDAEETRRPWRRWMHHCTFYGFLLCFASTSVAAIYHVVFGWVAPYAYTSLPVVLGTLGGLGLLVGPAGLFLVDRRRDPALTHSTQASLDAPFLAMLFLTSLTGLLLLALREGSYMMYLLIVHLAFVLALFVTLPYGKFVHGIYRAAALMKFRQETNHEATKA
jgi:citrate/tricarballylate utilization protein